MGLPVIPGGPISIAFEPQLTAHRGRLLSGNPHVGTAVYAAGFIRQRKIVLAEELFQQPAMLRFILAHELFHFVWPRLSNGLRAEYSELLRCELRSKARAELGESSEVRKTAFLAGTPCWREYVCESFCDTGAWFYCTLFYCTMDPQPNFRLGKRWREIRSRWFIERFARYWEARYS